MTRDAIPWDEIHGSRAQFQGVVTLVFGSEFKVALDYLSRGVKSLAEHGYPEERVDWREKFGSQLHTDGD